MAGSLATKITISADDRASDVFRKVSRQADQTAAQILRVGASTSRAFGSVGLDFGGTDLGRFTQHMATLTSQVSALRREAGGTFSELKKSLQDNIALIGRDTRAYIANTQAAIANGHARLDFLDKAITANKTMMAEIQRDPKWKWKIDANGIRDAQRVHDIERETNGLMVEQSTLIRRLEVDKRTLAAATAANAGKMSAFGKSLSIVKTGASSLISFLGGPWAVGITAAIAAVGYLATAESQAEKEAKKYGTTLGDINAEYERLVKGADGAALATKALSEAQQTALAMHMGGIERQYKKLVEDLKNRSRLTEWIPEIGEIELQFTAKPVKEAYTAYKQLFDELKNKPLDAQNVQELFKAFGDLDRAMQDVAAADTSVWGTNAREANRLSREVQVTMSWLKSLGDMLTQLGAPGMQMRLELPAAHSLMQAEQKLLQEMQKESDNYFKKTREGQLQSLQADIKKWRAHYTVSGSAQDQANLKHAEESLKSFLDKGASGGKRAAAGAGQLQSALAAVNDELVRLTLTEKDYERFKFDQKLAGYEKAGVSVEKLRELTEAWTRAEQKRASEKNLQVLADFEKEYLSVMQGNEAAQIASIRERAKAYEEAGADAVRVAQWQAEQEIRYSRNAAAGMKLAFRDYADDATNMAKNTGQIIGTTFSGLEDVWVQFCTTGKLAFSSFANSILADLARIAMRQTVTGPLASALSSAVGGLFSTGVSGSYVASGWSGMPEIAWNAKGNVFSSGNGLDVFSSGNGLDEYVNGIVRRPTAFTFAKGGAPRLGVMGEAGAEAIMPLTRMASGDLGVRATQPQVFINVNNNSSAQVSAETAQEPSGALRIDLFIDEVDRRLAGRITDGTAQTGMALDRTRNLNRAHALYRK